MAKQKLLCDFEKPVQIPMSIMYCLFVVSLQKFIIFHTKQVCLSQRYLSVPIKARKYLFETPIDKIKLYFEI